MSQFVLPCEEEKYWEKNDQEWQLTQFFFLFIFFI